MSAALFNRTIKQSMRIPSQVLDDQPAHKDYLDFKSYAQVISDLIIQENTKTPLTIGVFGRWGMGKTTLLQLLEKELSQQGLVTIWFNAWQYSNEDELWAAFLQSMLNKIQHSMGPIRLPFFKLGLLLRRIKWNDVPRLLLSLLLRVIVVLIPILIIDPVSEQLTQGERIYLNVGGGVAALVLATLIVVKPLFEAIRSNVNFNISDFLKTSDYQEHIAFLDRFKEHFANIVQSLPQKGTKKLAVFIDDLDRCSPEQTIQVLDAIKLFVDIPGCIYVLGLDVDVVQKAVAAKYLNDPTAQHEYMSKIIQIPFQLPPLTRTEMVSFLEQLELDLPSQVCRDVFVTGLVVNPREVKRTINIFLLLWNLAAKRKELTDKINPVRLAKIVVIQQAFPELHKILQKYPGYMKDLELYFREKPPGSVIEENNSDNHKTGVLSGEDSRLPQELRPFVQNYELRNMLLITHSPWRTKAEGPNGGYDFDTLSEEDIAIYFTLTNRVSTPSNWQRSEEALYNELVILLHGDREVAERLIQREQKDFPNESRGQWIVRARDRLLYDRGAFTP